MLSEAKSSSAGENHSGSQPNPDLGHPFPIPNSPSNTPPSMSSKWMKLGLLFLVVLIIPAGIFVLSRTQSKKPAPSPAPTPVSTATAVPTESPIPSPTIASPSAVISISSVDPNYIPMNYSTLGKDHLSIVGSGFQKEAKVYAEGPYDLGTGQIVNGESFQQIQLIYATTVSEKQILGTIPPGLPNGYFKIVVANPDGKSTSTGLALLRGDDPDEK